MHINKKCLVCGTQFIAKRENQRFCKRRCFRIDYSRRTREANSVTKYPVFVCPNCGTRHELDFSPAENHRKWGTFACLNCKKTTDQLLEMAKEEGGISSTF